MLKTTKKKNLIFNQFVTLKLREIKTNFNGCPTKALLKSFNAFRLSKQETQNAF